MRPLESEFMNVLTSNVGLISATTSRRNLEDYVLLFLCRKEKLCEEVWESFPFVAPRQISR